MDAPPRRGMDSSRPLLDSVPTTPMTTTYPRQMGPVDPDTCRICRGEGAAGEPLFYPCKCSGSIKYVHQDCLMEWLSHSQKKHCELCKTPFRFTKLYSPSMPKSLPVHVFVSHMAKHLFRQMLHWLRAALVVSVWLFWLPYMMRSIWTFYFWVSDEGVFSSTASAPLDVTRLPDWMVSGPTPNTCPSSPLHALRITSIAEIMGSDLFRGLDSWATVVNKDPISAAVINMIATSLRKVLGTSATAFLDQYATTVINGSRTRPSLLSNVAWLRNLTRSPILNYALVVILEGQIITIAVIVSFILIILVRDYVVQQQPEINMRAAFGGRVIAELNDQDGDEVDQDMGALIVDAEEEEEMEEDGQAVAEPFDRPATPAEMDEPELLDEPMGRRRSASETLQMRPQHFGSDTALYADALRQNPSFRAGALPPMAHQTDDQQPEQDSAPAATAEDFLDLWRESNNDGRRFLRLVHERGLDERMQAWVAITHSILDAESTHDNGQSSRPSLVIGGDTADINDADDLMRTLGSPAPVGRTDDVDYTSDQEEIPDLALRGKGKGKQVVDDDEMADYNAAADVPDAWEDEVPSQGTSRRDSRSDNRPIQPSPLQYGGSWSFGDLPDELGPDPNYVNPPATEASQPVAPERVATPGIEALADGPRLLPPPLPVDDDDTPDELQEPQEDPVPEPQGLLDRVANLMFADIERANVELVLEPEVEVVEIVADGDALDAGDGADEAEADGPDAADVEDLEDFEGVMELLGMRGPIVGLVQNSLFCAVLVSLTIFVCVFVPYNIGRIALWVVVNPSSIVRAMFELSKVVQDVVVLATGFVSWLSIGLVHLGCCLLASRDTIAGVMAGRAWDLTYGAALSITDAVVSDFAMSASEIRNFSAVSHVALVEIKGQVSAVFSLLGQAVVLVASGRIFHQLPNLVSALSALSTSIKASMSAVPGFLLDPSVWVIPVRTQRTELPAPELASWSSQDRVLAILCGYLALALLAGLYLRRGAPITSGRVGQQWEASVVDMINQASGVMKVIVVISIEMLLFPLYCGLLLDAALLPLFEDATVMSRAMFTCNYPITSVFVHWFVGTGYMFHFALFVSMCRKVMRRGVLYFIRDPDDPEFHPVRDVLERSLVAQLRKILFSAFVYGALVIVCLGGVVWGLWYTLPSLLPIHYSSNEPVLEFPIDLLFYNFAMPLAVRFFKPSDSLHAMYTWWFRRCARGLRLTWFLFGERRIDEEGVLVLAEDSEHRRLPWWRTAVLEVHDGEVVPMRWGAVLDGGGKQPLPPIEQAEFVSSASAKRTLVESGQLIPSGRLVRTPASDQIKIQRGMRVFRSAADVDEATANDTVDQLAPDAFTSDAYQLAYVPPKFGLRIFLFILFIWLFAASTGVGLTIVPLVFGRWVFKSLIPSHIRTNDIYAFSIGIYALGSVAYATCHLRSVVSKTRKWLAATVASWFTPNAPFRFAAGVLTTSRLVYAYSTLIILLPLLTAAVMELYVIVPLHTVMYRPASRDGDMQTTNDGRHTVRVIQAWTLGVLYLKLGARLVSDWYEDTRLAIAIQAVMHKGMLEPDIGVLTRVFVIPGVTLGCLALFGPVLATRGILAHGYFAHHADDPASLAVVHRLAYPTAALILWAIWMGWRAMAVFNRWTVHIRDEAYLIGERLHNFGVTSTSPARVRATDWRAGGNRL